METSSIISVEQVHILVNAYMRGGSSFATNLLTMNPSTFYFYEPLLRFAKFGYFTGDGQMCDILSSHCRYLLQIRREREH